MDERINVPSSPTHTDDGSSTTAPPSPTLSSRSSHFHNPTSLALRDNNPQLRNPSVLLSPLEGRNHRRKGSNATFATVTDTTEHGRPPRQDEELRHLTSNTTSETRASRSVSEPEGHVKLDTEIFRFRPNDLAMMLDPKNMDALELIGGIPSLLEGLGTTADMGLRGASLAQSMSTGPKRPGAGMGASQRHDPEKAVPAITPTHLREEKSTDWNSAAAFAATLDVRRRIYGENVLPHRATKSLLSLIYAALRDKVLVLLSVAAVVSLALGLVQDFGTPIAPGEPKVDWVEGVAIMIAILIVVVVGSVNDWQKERQFQVLNDKKEERGVKVIRGGVETQVVVGDIALLEPGEIVPCDGVFLSGHNVRCDESAATGESDAIKKVSFDECIANRESAHTDCFVISGSKVLEGVGKYVVVAVGSKSFNGKIMMALRGDADNTPLQIKLNAFAELIAKLGSAAGLILFTALLIRFFVQLGTGEPQRTANQKGLAFVNILIISVTLIVVAVPEGLPLAVTLALAFATKRMTYEKLLVRILGSCETMANASVVCTDKTGTLTQNSMTVVAGSVGIHAKFVRLLENNEARTNADGPRKHLDDFSLDQAQLNTALSPQLRDLFNEAIAVNSTAFQDKSPETGELMFVGSKTETALLKFAQELQWPDFKATRDAAVVLQMIPFSSERKAMGVVVKTRQGKFRLYLKGASEILSKKCVSHVVVHKPGTGNQSAAEEIETAAIDELANDNITRTTIFYANQTLRTIALCYRDFDTWPPNDAAHEHSEVSYDDLARDLTLIGIVGIEDPLRPGVLEAVKKCQMAGVTVKMCTGDNVLTARSIATQCGIFTAGGVIMEGPVFRDLSPAEKMEIVPRLQVLARSSPEDKRILVETLRQIGEIVGVTGDGTNDGPALKTAHVGFSMGIAGTEVAKEASDIILMDDNFASIVKAIMWGRCVNDAVRKFLQFQVSTNVTAVVITFVTAVASTQEASVLTAVQLLWINIIMDTFAALALATDPATEALLDRKPDKKTAPLFSVDMYKQIMFQSLYQITVTLIFHFLGSKILGFHDTTSNKKHDLTVQTLVFNAFVFAQIFNSVNCRRLDRKLNIFEGVLKNYYFMAITLIEIAAQIVIVFVGGSAFSVTPIGGREWGISLALGFVSIPLGALIRLMPSEPFEVLFRRVGLLGKTEILPTTAPNPDAVGWNAITRVRDDLNTFANVRGGRVRSSSFVVNSRMARLSQDRERPVSLLAMAPTLMMGTIAASHAWTQLRSLSDPTQDDPSRSSAALWEGKLQLHPDTPPEDPLFRRFGDSRSKMLLVQASRVQ
ncbi:Ca-transporting ATPase [Mycena pura]|uniref:Calcium-transporting ATPase n=1 Tax=Mycena pura TaxID=153505 RepID=A0AAD7E4F9_9AGAR|nr:Ca-transporting ATPase [Mycena pura]